MKKNLKDIGQLELFKSIEDTFPISIKKEDRPTIVGHTSDEIKTTLNIEPEYYIPPETDPDYYPEELFLSNEELPDNIPTFEETPVYTEVDIPEDNIIEDDISKLIDFLNHEDSGEEKKPEFSEAQMMLEIEENHRNRKLLENIPFIVYENGFVDGLRTREYFTIDQSVRFYLNIIDHKRGYQEYEFLLPKITDYLKTHLQRNNNISDLRSFVKEAEDLKEQKGFEKVMLHLNGGADFLGMSLFYGRKEAIAIMENILRDNAQNGKENMVYQAIEKKYIDTFIVQTEGQQELDKLVENRENILHYFHCIHTILHNHYIDSGAITHIGKDMRESYKMFFNMLYNCKKKIREIGVENKYDFEDRFHDEYAFYVPNLSEAIRDIIDYLQRNKILGMVDMNFLVPMYASFLKKGNEADIIHVAKRNMIRDYIYNKTRNKSDPINIDKNQERLEKTAAIFVNLEPIENGPLGSKRLEEANKKESNELLIRNNDPRISELDNLLEEEGLTHQFFIDKKNSNIVNRDNNSSIPVSQIIGEDKEFRKISILEWAIGDELEVILPNKTILQKEGEGNFDEQMLALQNILRQDKKLSEIRFFITEDEQYISHRLVVENNLPLNNLFAYSQSNRPSIILERRNKVDKDLPF